jgi:hypothetical protein
MAFDRVMDVDAKPSLFLSFCFQTCVAPFCFTIKKEETVAHYPPIHYLQPSRNQIVDLTHRMPNISNSFAD